MVRYEKSTPSTTRSTILESDSLVCMAHWPTSSRMHVRCAMCVKIHMPNPLLLLTWLYTGPLWPFLLSTWKHYETFSLLFTSSHLPYFISSLTQVLFLFSMNLYFQWLIMSTSDWNPKQQNTSILLEEFNIMPTLGSSGIWEYPGQLYLLFVICYTYLDLPRLPRYREDVRNNEG
jgi:hypothetical protein